MSLHFVVKRTDNGAFYSGAGLWTDSLDRAYRFKHDSDHASTCCLGARVEVPATPIRHAANAGTTIEILQVRERKTWELVDHGTCEGCKRTKCGRS